MTLIHARAIIAIFTRRHLFRWGSAAAAVWNGSSLAAANTNMDPRLKEAVAKLEYLTGNDKTWTVLDKLKSGAPGLTPDKLREAGLTPETWSFEVTADAPTGSRIAHPLTRAQGNALDWNGLMHLAERHAVRFLHVCTCCNGPDPFHIDLWEGVPFREIIWLTNPQEKVRRVYYGSWHPPGVHGFQSSLALSQVLETPPGDSPVILAYKRNGQPIPAAHGGPVRMVVPGSYSNKSLKWVQRAVLTNDFKSNDSDAAEFNNDTESLLKTRARFMNPPAESAANRPVAITGMAQVGISGLKQVQYCVRSQEHPPEADDPAWTKADWKNAEILPPPSNWGGGLPGGKLPPNVLHFDSTTGLPREWPLRFTIVHWAAMIPPLPAGNYDLCCRTIDNNGIPQPMPRPLPRTGYNAIHTVTLSITA